MLRLAWAWDRASARPTNLARSSCREALRPRAEAVLAVAERTIRLCLTSLSRLPTANKSSLTRGWSSLEIRCETLSFIQRLSQHASRSNELILGQERLLWRDSP